MRHDDLIDARAWGDPRLEAKASRLPPRKPGREIHLVAPRSQLLGESLRTLGRRSQLRLWVPRVTGPSKSVKSDCFSGRASQQPNSSRRYR